MDLLIYGIFRYNGIYLYTGLSFTKDFILPVGGLAEALLEGRVLGRQLEARLEVGGVANDVFRR